jgi:outer membrane protein assembly factor BamB
MKKIAIFGKKGSIAKFDITSNNAIWIGKLEDKYTPSSIAQINDYLLVYSNTSFTGKGMIHCFLEDNGKLLWSYEIKDICNVSHPFAPLMLDNYLYYMPSSKEVAKLSLNNGELMFRKKFEKSMFKAYGLMIISDSVFLISKKDALKVNKESGDVSPYPKISESINLKEISASLGNGTSYLSSISLAYPQSGDSGMVMTGGGDAGGGGE